MEAADVLVETIEALSSRAPAVGAAAASALGGTRLNLFFGDGSEGSLIASRSRLVVGRSAIDATVDVHFDDRALALLFDAQRRPTDESLEGSLDVRGPRQELLAAWRCFSILSQRASGMRIVQAIWMRYRAQARDGRWSGRVDKPQPRRRRRGNGKWDESRWPALAYLDDRHPAARELIDKNEPVLAPARSLWNGREGASWQDQPEIFDNDLHETLARCKRRVVDEVLRLIPRKAPREDLYELMRQYVTREGKGLRPTLTIATCMALGGRMEDALRTAAALEFFHNGFLVHDDIADESTHRRGLPTLHEAYGVGLAVNTGDAMNLFAVDMTLSNLESLGLARTLGLIHEILHMCRETVEGQAIELGWIRRNTVPRRDADYSRMSTKKTGWYTCISPCRMGAVAAGETDPARLDGFNETFRLIGIAFQIQDDVLNLIGETELYGKEPLGDLLEGKRTVMMIHLFREASERVRRRMQKINTMPRAEKTQAHAEEMLAAMKKAGSIDYAIALADKLASQGVRRFEKDVSFIEENPAKAVLRQIANYVTTRAL
ncbi:MAG: polyprenyl synthetase family protein [Gammaproteobacteria bacterium]|nr:polyprenyl synthetase family protein [Gammaproteobacteria bacterium]